MSKRAKKSVKRARVLRSVKHESLEDRIVMSANPLGGPALTHHGFGGGFVEEDPVAIAPALGLHGFVEDNLYADAPALGHHLLGGSLGNSALEFTPVHDPDADFWTSIDVDSDLSVEEELGGRIEQTLSNAHDLTGQDEMLSKYGFTGEGQTVAVIDSGIAWSHTALGEGYGSGYRVVGGWDFTENDADPYDDGSAGSHGTHVAGIVGAEGTTHSGVATGVDLVGLRVFDDAGNGYFSWVEQALSWVHTNKDAFDNPITAVNLSLGTEYNSHNIPGWAMLEEEFAQLEADGIFISVSAGNSFTNYNTPGVSYPAASDHVIPVMSVDDNGSLSYFSQRADYAIAAPGRGIVSTVPDYAAGDADTIDDDWASFSGTSMAAPYVAGASVLVREAMEFVGMSGIDQWDIYNHMMATGDQFFDSATSDTYTRLNLESAIDALMPTDDYGSTLGTAHDLGTLVDSQTQSQSLMSGVISTLDDSDYFSFTAGGTGQVTFTASSITHDLETDWAGFGGEGWVDGGGASYVMDVVAGQEYTVALSTSDGLGYYDLSIELDETFTYTDWGAASIQSTHAGLAVDGEQWYRVTAAQVGLFTAESLPQTGAATVAIYDSNLLAIAGDGSARADATVILGQELFIQVTGESATIDLQLTNAVSVDGSTVTLTGTTGDDAITFSAGANDHTVSLNEVSYTFDAVGHTDFDLNGGGGGDTLNVTGSSGDETSTMSIDQVTVDSSDGWDVQASGFSLSVVDSGAGNDSVILYDTAADDLFTFSSSYASLSSDGQEVRCVGCESITVYNTHNLGHDQAYLHGTSGDDTFVGRPTYARFLSGTSDVLVYGFDQVDAYSNGGNDRAYHYDSAGDDVFIATPTLSTLQGDGFFNRAHGFSQSDAYTFSGGNDRAYFYDSEGVETFTGRAEFSKLSGSGFVNIAWGFDRVDAYSSGGEDRAYHYDTDGNDFFTGRPEFSTMWGDGYRTVSHGFSQVDAYTFGGGFDRAYLYDSSGSDILVARPEYSHVTGSGFRSVAWGFDQVDGYIFAGGEDTAYFYDSDGSDQFVARSNRSTMSGTGFHNNIWYAERAYAYGGSAGSTDNAYLYGEQASDNFGSGSNYSWISGDAFYSYAKDFENVNTYPVSAPQGQMTLSLESTPALVLNAYSSAQDGQMESVTSATTTPAESNQVEASVVLTALNQIVENDLEGQDDVFVLAEESDSEPIAWDEVHDDVFAELAV